MQRINNENRARALAMLKCRRNENDVAIHFNVERLTFFLLKQRVRFPGIFAYRPRPSAPLFTFVRQDKFKRQRHLRDRFLTAKSTRHLVIGTRGVHVIRYTVKKL